MEEAAIDRTIRLACQGSRLAPLGALEVIQGDLKELSEENAAKLRWRIEHLGFDAPLFVWQDKILDGTQRVRILHEMLADGWHLPEGMVPVCDIEAATLAEARERLLGYVSQYGTVTDEGLYEFLSTMPDPHLASLDLPGFNLDAFRVGWLQDVPEERLAAPVLHPTIDRSEVTAEDVGREAARLDRAPASPKEKTVLTCPKCGKDFLVDKG
jgi:hypothetical protein